MRGAKRNDQDLPGVQIFRVHIYVDVDLDSSSSGVRVDCRRAASTIVPDNHQSNN